MRLTFYKTGCRLTLFLYLSGFFRQCILQYFMELGKHQLKCPLQKKKQKKNHIYHVGGWTEFFILVDADAVEKVSPCFWRPGGHSLSNNYFFPPLVLGGGLESGRSARRAAGAQARLKEPSSAFRQWVWTSRKLCRPVSVNTCPNPPRCPPATHTSPALPTGLLAAGQRSVWSSIMSNLFPNSESSFSLKLYWNLVNRKKKHHTSVVFILNPEHRHASLLVSE